MAFDLSIVPITLFILALAAVGASLVVVGALAGPRRPNPVKAMPYESGVDPFHDARRRLNIRYHLLAVAFLVFDVELLFLYPWAVALRETPRVPTASAPSAATEAAESPAAGERIGLAAWPTGARAFAQSAETGSANLSNAARPLIFWGGVLFLAILTLGFVYDWRKGVFRY
ncbi:NADH-quinone oxidoreductase subunit A [Thermopirellula anaerolimosa]